MTEEAAAAWIADRFGTEQAARIDRLLRMIVEENGRQNLIAPSTIASIWQRHALDSAQLLTFDRPGGTWLDIGTGGGFPGLVVAILRTAPVVMIEPRGKRAAFLDAAVRSFDLDHAKVVVAKVEHLREHADIISARAVASLGHLFGSAGQCASVKTRWILPKGRTAATELAEVQTQWRGVFHVEQSIAAADAGIIIAEQVSRR